MAPPLFGVTTLLGLHFDRNEAIVRLNQRFGFEVAGHPREIAEIGGEKCGLLLSVLRIEEAATNDTEENYSNSDCVVP